MMQGGRPEESDDEDDTANYKKINHKSIIDFSNYQFD